MITITRGDDYIGARSLSVLVTDPANDDEPVDLTGNLLTFMVKRYRRDANADALITKTVGAGITIPTQTGADEGTALIAIEAADTEDLDAGAYFSELEADDAVGIVTLWQERFVIEGDLVRA